MRLRRDGGTLDLLGARIITYAAAGLVILAIARILGPKDYGFYATGAALASLSLVFSYLGQDQHFLTGRLSIEKLKVRNGQVAILSVILLALFCNLWPHVSVTTRLCGLFIGLGIILNRLLLPYLVVPLANLDFQTRAKRELGLLATWPILGFFIGLILGASPIHFGLGGFTAALLLLIPGKTRFKDFRSLFRDRSLRDLRDGAPYAISGALYVIYFQSDVAVLGTLSPAKTVGLYAAACTFVSVGILASTAVSNDIMRTRLYKSHVGYADFRNTAIQLGKVNAACGILAGTAMIVGAHILVSVVYGSAYRNATTLVGVLGVAVIIYYFSNWASNIVIAAGNIRLVVLSQLGLSIINLAGNFLLIPRFGAAGSAWMTVSCELAGVAIYGVILIKRKLLAVIPS